MSYLGDFAEDTTTVTCRFNTRTAAGVPVALVGGVISIYKSGDLVQDVTGVNLIANFDDVVGLNQVVIDTSSSAFYAVGYDYDIVITTGTVDSISVVGAIVGTFSIENRSLELLKDDGTAVFNRTTDSLQAIKDASGTIAEIVAAIFALYRQTGTVVADGSNSATTFKTNLPSTVNDFYKDQYLLFLTGTMALQVKKVLPGYNGSTKFITCNAFTATPTAGDTFALINQ